LGWVEQMLIEKGNLPRNALAGEVAIVTGAGRGIGLETARTLLWLGARVVIAEIDERTGTVAAESMAREFGEGRALFIRTDVGDEESVKALASKTMEKFGRTTLVINNATVFPMGPVTEVPIGSWDLSYRVNLRGPVLMARAFLPDMIVGHHGTFVCVSSSGAAPFMGAYEVFKTSQVELANTISAEVEGTGVNAFTIGPGIVATPGFLDGGGKVAAYMGMTTDELLKMNENALLTAEEAGIGFAGAAAMAARYHGKEVSSMQVLKDLGIGAAAPTEGTDRAGFDRARAMEGIDRVMARYTEQSGGWRSRNLFERQWVSRDFKKQTGMSIDEMEDALGQARKSLGNGLVDEKVLGDLKSLRNYFSHQGVLLKGFEKDRKKLDKGLRAIDVWIGEIDDLLRTLNG
jgi:NAD(P)-dependent dehydrogenase (short-subunit alcohol dehydrogenase family)